MYFVEKGEKYRMERKTSDGEKNIGWREKHRMERKTSDGLP